jgi:glycosyltransferase involved in cell wall biosynthesis
MMISTHGRRLAVIDSHFPWKQSGLRYWENYEIYLQRPDTLFFATDPYIDPMGNHLPNAFPAHVHHISQLTSMIVSENITDIYCVFLNMAVSLIGNTRLSNGYMILESRPELNILPMIYERNIKLHTTVYPGGGLQPNTPLELCRLDDYYSTIFTNIQEVLTHYPSSIYVPGVINSDFYTDKPKSGTPPIKLIFSAHLGSRKNFHHVAEAFNQLDDNFHLHIVGNWQDYLHLLTNDNYTYHGLLNPDQAARIYRQAHVVISSSKADWTASDGFPTTTAGDAMSTGCLLVSSNPRQDRFVLQSGVDYIEITENRSLVEILWWVKDHFQEAMIIGANGTHKIRSFYASEVVVSTKLKAMGLIENTDETTDLTTDVYAVVTDEVTTEITAAATTSVATIVNANVPNNVNFHINTNVPSKLNIVLSTNVPNKVIIDVTTNEPDEVNSDVSANVPANTIIYDAAANIPDQVNHDVTDNASENVNHDVIDKQNNDAHATVIANKIIPNSESRVVPRNLQFHRKIGKSQS